MLNWLFNWRPETLEGRLNNTTTVKVHGIKFKIKKMTVEHFLEGSKVMKSFYDTYAIKQDPRALENPDMIKRVKDHWKDVFMASVVYPKIKRKIDEPDGILVDNLFTDWELASDLYQEIMAWTYGKKKASLIQSI